MITGVAIRYFDRGVIALPAPARHGDVIFYVMDNYGRRTFGSDEQGFVDENGVFYGRYDAYRIAEENDQLIGEHVGPDGMLFSEDLW